MAYKAEERENISKLDYDFRPHADVTGVTPEFEPEQMSAYWGAYGGMLRRNRADLDSWGAKRKALPEGDTESARHTRDEFDRAFEEWETSSSYRLRKLRAEMLGALCSQQPSTDELLSLPGRVFDDFESYMQGELAPKG